MWPTFRHPLFLLALPIALVPLILYLLRRWRLRRLEWAAMQFLLASARRSARRTRLRDLLLLIARTVCLAAAVFAVARPDWHPQLPLASAAPRTLALIVDASYSMGASGEKGSPFERAKQAAADMVRALGVADRAALLVSFLPARAIIAEPTGNRQRLLAAIESIELSEMRTDVAGALRLASRALAFAPTARKEIHLFTDMQKNAWDAVSPADIEGGEHERPRLILHDTGGLPPGNLAVTALESTERIIPTGLPTWFEVHIKNYSAEDAPDVRVSFSIDGLARESRTISLRPGEEHSILFAAQFDDQHGHYVQVTIPPDALNTDNRRSLAVSPRSHVAVLLVDGRAVEANKAIDSFFIRLALRPERVPGEISTVFHPRVSPTALVSPSDFMSHDVVVLANVAHLSSEQFNALHRHVQSGGGLLVFAGPETDFSSYVGAASANAPALLPASPVRVVESEDGLSPRFHTNNPALSAFRVGTRIATDARIFRYLQLSIAPSEHPVCILSTVANDEPLILEKTIGRGRVILMATSADDSWNTLPKSAIFLPLVQELVGYLASGHAQRLNFDVGELMEVTVPAHAFRQTVRIFLPDATEPLIAQVMPKDERFVVSLEQTTRSGIYELEVPGADGSVQRVLCAVNVDPREGDLARLSLDEVRARTGQVDIEVVASAQPSARALARRSEMGPLLLILVCVLLFAELGVTQFR